MAICPRCKSDLPLLSKICPVCDYVIQEEGQTSVEELISNLEQILYDVKSLPEPSFKRSVGGMINYVLLLIALMALVLALATGGLLFWIVVIGAGAYSVWGIIKRLGKKSDPNQLKNLVNEFEYNKGIATRNFGKNLEVSKLIMSISGQLYDTVENHKAAKRKIGVMWTIVIAVILIIGAGTTAVSVAVPSEEEKAVDEKVEKMVEEGTTEETAKVWVKLVQDYVEAGYDEISGEEARLNIVKEIIKSDVSAAEDFFKQYCQGQMGDKDCAVEIVKAYKSISGEKAAEFVNSVKLRYKSDVDKLKKLL